MISRRSVLVAIASSSTVALSGIASAKGKHHLNGNTLVGPKIKENGKHKVHKAGKHDVFAEVQGGKIVGMSAPGMDVKKVRSTKKLADAGEPRLIPANTEVAQVEVYYYGYWVYDQYDDYYYWYTSDVVVVDSSWVDVVVY